MGHTAKRDRDLIRAVLPALCVIAAALLCRRIVVTTESPFLEQAANYLRIFLYLGLFSAWGVTAHRRVIQLQVRRQLAFVAVLMTAWLTVREFRWHLVMDADASRFLWYAYYIPILLIPLIAFFVSLSLGKGERYRLPKWTTLLYIPTLLLIAATLTNDLHGRLFLLPESAGGSELNYGYGFLFYILTAWGIACTLAAFFTMLKKCRVPRTKKFLWAPLVPFAAAVLYIALYTARAPFVTGPLGDLAVFDCLVFTAFFECCIQCGLIPSNTRYSDLFRASADIAMQITDKDYETRYASRRAEPVPREAMIRAETAPVILPEGKRLRNMPVNGGRAVWTEDIAELLEKQEELESVREQLSDRSELIRVEYEQQKAQSALEEQNRLYDLMQRKTQSQLDGLRSLAAAYRRAETDGEKRRVLARILFLGSFIKRRRDFILTHEDADSVRILSGALAESCRSLERLGVAGAYYVEEDRRALPLEAAELAYDFFEDAAEALPDAAKYIDVSVGVVGGAPRCRVETDASIDTSPLFRRYPAMSAETDGEGGCSLLLPLKGGDAL